MTNEGEQKRANNKYYLKQAMKLRATDGHFANAGLALAVECVRTIIEGRNVDVNTIKANFKRNKLPRVIEKVKDSYRQQTEEALQNRPDVIWRDKKTRDAFIDELIDAAPNMFDSVIYEAIGFALNEVKGLNN